MLQETPRDSSVENLLKLALFREYFAELDSTGWLSGNLNLSRCKSLLVKTSEWKFVADLM